MQYISTLIYWFLSFSLTMVIVNSSSVGLPQLPLIRQYAVLSDYINGNDEMSIPQMALMYPKSWLVQCTFMDGVTIATDTSLFQFLHQWGTIKDYLIFLADQLN